MAKKEKRTILTHKPLVLRLSWSRVLGAVPRHSCQSRSTRPTMVPDRCMLKFVSRPQSRYEGSYQTGFLRETQHGSTAGKPCRLCMVQHDGESMRETMESWTYVTSPLPNITRADEMPLISRARRQWYGRELLIGKSYDDEAYLAGQRILFLVCE